MVHSLPRTTKTFQMFILTSMIMINFAFQFIVLLRIKVFISDQGLLSYAFIISLITFSAFFSRPFVAFIADNSRRKAFGIAAGSYLTAPLMLVYANFLPLVWPLALLEGLGDAAHHSSLRMAYYDMGSQTRKESITSSWYLAFTGKISIIASSLFIWFFYSPSHNIALYLCIFTALFTVYVALGFLGLFNPELSKKKDQRLLKSPKKPSSINKLTGFHELNKIQLIIIICYALYFFIIGLANTSLNGVKDAIFYDQLAFANIALVFGLFELASLIGSYIVYHHEKENRKNYLSVLQISLIIIIMEIFSIAYLLDFKPIFFITLVMISNLLSGVVQLVIESTWHHVLDSEMRARASGILGVISSLVTFTPILGAWIYQEYGVQILIILVLILKGVSVIIFTSFYFCYEKDVLQEEFVPQIVVVPS